MALFFYMNVPNGSSLGLGFSIFDLDKERDAFSFSHFHHYFRHIHDYALRGVAFNFDDLLFNSSRLLACLNMPSLITL
jgi:hypothetical protein